MILKKQNPTLGSRWTSYFKTQNCDNPSPQFGFITYEVGDSKKLFFHVKEVQDGLELQTGDEVEFSVVLNQRTGKCSACNVRRVR